MDKEEFYAVLDHLGWSIAALARLLDRPVQTVRQWAMGRAPVPLDVQEWLYRRAESLNDDPPPPPPPRRGTKAP